MSTDVMARPASSRQLAYIERLYGEMGEAFPETGKDLSSTEASKLITRLVSNTSQNGASNRSGANGRLNEARLGMAMKECFRVWNGLGRDVLGLRRKAFIEEAINTYNLFTEIVERAELEISRTG